MWKHPSDGWGFEEYLKSQGIPVVRVPFAKRLAPVPTAETGEYECYTPEDEVTRLGRLLTCEETCSKIARKERDQAKLYRDKMRRSRDRAFGLFSVAWLLLLGLIGTWLWKVAVG